MSLKSFHIVFVSASLILGFGFAVWCWNEFSSKDSIAYLGLGILSLVGSVGLAAYLTWFMKKINRLAS